MSQLPKKAKPAGKQDKVRPPPGPDKVFLYFTDVTEEDMVRIAEASTKAEVKQLLKECMKVDQAEGFRTEILADMHFHNYSFCMSQSFAPNKTSTLLSIMKLVLEDAVSERRNASEAFGVFKEWLLKHSVERPPWSVGIFTFDDVKAVMDYIHNSFFRHYRLYMYTYMTHCDLNICMDPTASFVAAPFMMPMQLRPEHEVTPRDQPELSHLFGPSEHEQTEAKEGGAHGDARAALVKKKVDEGVQKLLAKFEERLQEQDTKFTALMGK